MARLCPSSQFDCRGDVLFGERRDATAVDGGAIGEVEIADFRCNLQTDSAVAEHKGREVELDAEFMIFDGGDPAAAGAGLGNGNRDFATGQERGILSADGNHIRLSQNANQSVLTKGLNEILEGCRAISTDAEQGAGSAGDAANQGWRRASEGQGIENTCVVAKIRHAVGAAEVDAQVAFGGLGDFRKLHLKHDLLAAGNFHEVVDLPVGRGDFNDLLGNLSPRGRFHEG